MSIEKIAYIAIQEMNAYNAVQVKCLLFVLGDNKIISKNHEIGNLDRTFLVLFGASLVASNAVSSVRKNKLITSNHLLRARTSIR